MDVRPLPKLAATQGGAAADADQKGCGPRFQNERPRIEEPQLTYLVAAMLFSASSAEFVGERWLRYGAEIAIQGDFVRILGVESIRLSGDHFQFAAETLHDAGRNPPFSPKPVEDELSFVSEPAPLSSSVRFCYARCSCTIGPGICRPRLGSTSRATSRWKSSFIRWLRTDSRLCCRSSRSWTAAYRRNPRSISATASGTRSVRVRNRHA